MKKSERLMESEPVSRTTAPGPAPTLYSRTSCISWLTNKDGAPSRRAVSQQTNTNRVTSTSNQSFSPFPDAFAPPRKFYWRSFSHQDHCRLSLLFRRLPDPSHDPSPSGPCNPCLTSTCQLPFPRAARHFPPCRWSSNLHWPCCGP